MGRYCKRYWYFLMVMGHTGIPRIGNQWIYSFHMPLFFFISGFLFNTSVNFYR